MYEKRSVKNVNILNCLIKLKEINDSIKNAVIVVNIPKNTSLLNLNAPSYSL